MYCKDWEISSEPLFPVYLTIASLYNEVYLYVNHLAISFGIAAKQPSSQVRQDMCAWAHLL
jgi:hypothetical protein